MMWWADSGDDSCPVYISSTVGQVLLNDEIERAGRQLTWRQCTAKHRAYL